MPTRMLPVKLTPAESIERAEQLSRAVNRLKDMRDAHKEAKAVMKREADELEDEVKRLARAHEDGEEQRPVEVHEAMDMHRGVVDMVRRDTHEVISSRPMTLEEHQRARQPDLPGAN